MYIFYLSASFPSACSLSITIGMDWLISSLSEPDPDAMFHQMPAPTPTPTSGNQFNSHHHHQPTFFQHLQEEFSTQSSRTWSTNPTPGPTDRISFMSSPWSFPYTHLSQNSPLLCYCFTNQPASKHSFASPSLTSHLGKLSRECHWIRHPPRPLPPSLN